MYYCKKEHLICFDVGEIIDLFATTNQAEVSKICKAKNISRVEFVNSRQKRELIEYEVVKKNKREKESIEIFTAIDTCVAWYSDPNKKVCFALKNSAQVDRLSVKNLSDLKKVIEENTSIDFAIWSNGLRKFQLKQYKDKLTTTCFYKKIKKTLDSYGNDLGQTNLFFILQGDSEKTKMEIDFNKLNKKLAGLNIKDIGEILTQHNQNNEFIVINQVYPEVKSMKKELSSPSLIWL